MKTPEDREIGHQAEVLVARDSACMETGELEGLAFEVPSSRSLDSFPIETARISKQATAFFMTMDHPQPLQDQKRRHLTVNSTSKEPRKPTEPIQRSSEMN